MHNKKELYNFFLKYIDDTCNEKENYEELINQIKLQQIDQNRNEIQEFIQLIIEFSNNHRRQKSFFSKIESIILFFKDKLKQTFSNLRIYDLFESNKRLLLFLFKENIIEIDTDIINQIEKNNDYKQYFQTEISPSQGENENSENELFERKREIGENDCQICSLIREDSVEEFIIYVTKNNVFLSSHITSSIFETNSFLIDHKPTLIEYAAFYGSYQIFNYLQINQVNFDSNLWLFVIHGRNPQLIHFLEDNHVDPKDMSYTECLEESIKCHHNEIATYFINNFVENSKENDFNENIFAYSFHYHNYEFIPENLENKFAFFYLCEYGYIELVKLFKNENEFNINERIISLKKIFFYEVLNFF